MTYRLTFLPLIVMLAFAFWLPPRNAISQIRDWRPAIDSIWGKGLPDDDKLAIFDSVWTRIDQNFACFHNITVNWDSLRTHYRPEVEQGVSRGRFAAIMNHMSLALREGHTQFKDNPVNRDFPLAPGVPLLYVGGWANNGHFGAGLTPLPDSSLLVYKAVDNHPLGLEPGDIVLGYHGIPWKELYPRLLQQELPLAGQFWGSSPSAHSHSFLMAAGMNWHLFDTIDIVKYGSRDTQQLALTALMEADMNLWCSEQLPLPGVPMLESADLFGPERIAVSWGMVEGSNIAYVYVYNWTRDTDQRFLAALRDIMFNHKSAGLILDFRVNFGGDIRKSNPGYNLLFNSYIETILVDIRCGDPREHLLMCPHPERPASYFAIDADPDSYYDKPIAVLIGPGAISAGDHNALRLKRHPRARFFGKSTNGAFNGPSSIAVGAVDLEDWNLRYAHRETYLPERPDEYLTHREFPVDESVWLSPDNVRQGIDDVAQAAIDWIRATTEVAVGASDRAAEPQLRISPNPVRNEATISFSLSQPGSVRIEIVDLLGRSITRAVDHTFPAGSHRIPWDARDCSPGNYLCLLQSAHSRRSIHFQVIGN